MTKRNRKKLIKELEKERMLILQQCFKEQMTIEEIKLTMEAHSYSVAIRLADNQGAIWKD